MSPNHSRPRLSQLFIITIFSVLLACTRGLDAEGGPFWQVSSKFLPTDVILGGLKNLPVLNLPTPRPFGSIVSTPTPDMPHPLPTLRTQVEMYVVQPGDTLGSIANRYSISLQQLSLANNLPNPDLLEVGKVLTIPVSTPQSLGPAFKIIPDSELVYGPTSTYLDVENFVRQQAGFLASYYEELEGVSLSGAQIVIRVAQEYSVNPRMLLAVLEYQNGWVTQPNPANVDVEYPLGLMEPARKGLYRQLAWAANNLNRGFYLWRVGAIAAWLLLDGSVVPIDPTINAGTAAVQHLYARFYDLENWQKGVSERGLFSTFYTLFGYPFDYALEPSLPPGLKQPPMQLPFEPAVEWVFTSGPHGGWGDGSAWAALDFAPPGDVLGCVQSDAWVVAVADGLIVRSSNGVVVQDLDSDGWEQTGWVVLYVHIETRDRVPTGVYLKAGERIGHPSCEGGFSTGTHVHLARRYNGEWIPADQQIPFVLDGWVSSGTGVEYDGYLSRDGQIIEAYAGRSPGNSIKR